MPAVLRAVNVTGLERAVRTVTVTRVDIPPAQRVTVALPGVSAVTRPVRETGATLGEADTKEGLILGPDPIYAPAGMV
jgi:hypothetical protein